MKVTYIGHATCLIEIAGRRILTDPVWARRVFFIKRLQQPGLPLKEVLPVDLVLLSHAHFDHLDANTLKKIDKETPIVCAKNLRKFIRLMGFKKVYELDWWQVIEIVGLQITAVPAKHFGGRWQLWDKILGYCGFVISSVKSANKSIKDQVYFAGDTGYFDAFKALAQIFNIETALLPIGAYAGPGKINFNHIHLDPEQAIQAFQDLKAKYLVPIHFGTYKLSVEPIEEPEQWLKEIAVERNLNGQIKILKPGESFKISNLPNSSNF